MAAIVHSMRLVGGLCGGGGGYRRVKGDLQTFEIGGSDIPNFRQMKKVPISKLRV